MMTDMQEQLAKFGVDSNSSRGGFNEIYAIIIFTVHQYRPYDYNDLQQEGLKLASIVPAFVAPAGT